MIKKLLFSVGLIVALTAQSQDTTSYRMVTCGFGELSFFNDDSTDMVSIFPLYGSSHLIFSNPADSLMYMIIDDAGNSGDRNLFTINPFTGTYTLVADLGIQYINSGDLGNDNTLYVITGNGNGTPGLVSAIDMTTFVETSLYTSIVSGSTNPTATEFNPTDSSLYIYESYNNNLYIYDLLTGTESAAFINNFADDEHHGAYYDEVNDVFHLGSYGGDLYISDNTYLNGGIYATSTENAIDLSLIEHTLRADTSYFSGFCPGTDSVLISTIYAMNSVSWMKDGVVIPGASNDSIWASETGIYQAIMEIGIGDGYMISEGIELDLFTVPNVNLSAPTDSLICFNETDITITGANPGGGTAQWYLNGAAISGETGQTITVSVAGSYNQIKTNANGCSDSSAAPYVVYVDPTPINVSISQAMNDSLICPTETITLDGASSGGTFQWYMNGSVLAGETGATYDATATGSYNQILTLASGCFDSAAVAFQIYDDPACGAGLIENSESILIYPNPASEFVIVNSNEIISEIEILDLSGKTVSILTGLSTFQQQLNVRELNHAIYVVKVTTGEKTTVIKFSK